VNSCLKKTHERIHQGLRTFADISLNLLRQAVSGASGKPRAAVELEVWNEI
jgi:hypothetical protein